MLREAVRAGSPVGEKAAGIMARGDLVPDSVVLEVIADRIADSDAREGFILDGFPRTVAQAEGLASLLAERGLELDAVIELGVDEAALQDRIAGRARETGAARADDNPETVGRRLAVYREQTAPVAKYYADSRMLRRIDGMKPIEEVSALIDEALSDARVKQFYRTEG
jgi:adenylate kinase